MLSKGDIKKLEEKFTTKEDLKRFATKFDLQKLEERIEENASKRQSELFNLIDSFGKEIRDEREFRAIASHQISVINEKLGLD